MQDQATTPKLKKKMDLKVKKKIYIDFKAKKIKTWTWNIIFSINSFLLTNLLALIWLNGIVSVNIILLGLQWTKFN